MALDLLSPSMAESLHVVTVFPCILPMLVNVVSVWHNVLLSKINALGTYKEKRWGMGTIGDWALSILYCLSRVSERGGKKAVI